MILQKCQNCVKLYKIIYLSIIFIFQTNVFSLDLESRIDSLLNQMSDDEKIEQLINNKFMTTPDNSRLNIPGFIMNDGPHGVRFEKASSFPTGIAVASTWDRKTAFAIGKAMGEEFWAFGIHQQLGPCIDLTQDPRSGRNAESGGEDPYLCGQIGVSVTRGIQNTPVIATVKHYMVEGLQRNRQMRDEFFTDRWATEHYGYNFRSVIQEGAVLSVMVSYNLINGVQASESSYLLDTLLRQRFGFPFYVVSDWGAVTIERSLQAITAGTDICMGNDVYKEELPLLVSRKTVSDDVLNKAVRNVLRTKICAGMTDFYPSGDKSFVNSKEHQQIALDGARKSIILLKNEGSILPLQKTIGKVALIGPNADMGNLNCYGSSETTPVYAISIKKGLENKIGEENVLYENGCNIDSKSADGFKNAKLLASQASVVIFAGGLDSTQEGEGYNGFGDRKNKSAILPELQLDLIDTLASVNPNIIVVIQSGGVCSMNRSIDKMKGLVYSFYAGQEAGNAIADVLFGDYNPSGRMPVTMPVSDSQLPEWNDDFTDDFGCGYRWFDEKKIVPEFAFGFGLSYTKFKYSNLKLSARSVPAGASVRVSVDVENVGTRPGEEVVQLYMSNTGSSLWMPQKELKGFDRISLGTGQKQTVVFELTSEDFYYWDDITKSYKVNPGLYIMQTGGSSDRLPLRDTLELTSSEGKPDLKVTEVFSVPRYPKKNDQVYFYALVKNQGNARVESSDKFSISFLCNDTSIASADDVSVTIEPGQVRLIGSSAGWNASSDAFVLKTVVDSSENVGEWIETNNTFAKQISLPGVDIGFEPVKRGMKMHCQTSVSCRLSGKNVIVNCGNTIVKSIAVRDLSGRSVSVSRGRFNGQTKINIAKLSSGLYFVECEGDGLRSVENIIIR